MEHTKSCVDARFRAWALNEPPRPPCACGQPDLDQTATAIAFGVLLACVAELGPTRRAVAAAFAAVALTDAIADEGDHGARTVRDH